MKIVSYVVSKARLTNKTHKPSLTETNMKIGYARVSTKDQNLDLQLTALKNAGCEKILKEKLSAIKDRPELNSMVSNLREGDVVVVKAQSDIESGQIAIVMINGTDATCKKVMKHEKGISLVSTNPAYSPMFYPMDEVETTPITIIGKVVELRAKF